MKVEIVLTEEERRMYLDDPQFHAAVTVMVQSFDKVELAGVMMAARVALVIKYGRDRRLDGEEPRL